MDKHDENSIFSRDQESIDTAWLLLENILTEMDCHEIDGEYARLSDNATIVINNGMGIDTGVTLGEVRTLAVVALDALSKLKVWPSKDAQTKMVHADDISGARQRRAIFRVIGGDSE